MGNDSLTMTYSAIVTGKDQKKIVRVEFERSGERGNEKAEGLLPDCKIVEQNGFSPEEVGQLEAYMAMNKDDIMQKAKVISNPLKWF